MVQIRNFEPFGIYYQYSGVSNNRTVWNKHSGQDIFPKLLNEQGCHSTDQYIRIYLGKI